MSKLFFVFDVESVGFHGEGFAYGFVVVDENGQQLDCGAAACTPARAYGDLPSREWVSKNCPALKVTHDSTRALRKSFHEHWQSWREAGAIMAADCPWPVEDRFLMSCLTEVPLSCPYPLIDVASVVLASGGDPIADFGRMTDELPKHDPLCDARQSARVLIEHLKKIAERK